MCSDAANGEYEEFKIKAEGGCPTDGEATSSESILHHLNHVLETLIGLDQKGLFMNHVDNSSASDCTHMCFSKMQEKVYMEHYTSWTSFVEDFESICLDAMKQSKKHSEMWNAANVLLHQGRRCIDQHSARARTNLGTDAKPLNDGGGESSHVKVGRWIESSPDVCKETGSGSATRNLVAPPCAEKQASITVNVKVEVKEEAHRVILKSGSSQSASMEGLEKDVTVDILEVSCKEEIRLKLDKQATDCTSSFGDTQDDRTDDGMDHQSCEAESDLRNGNGATSLADDISSLKRKKKALNPNWKTYRQGIEWRCRWLELRVKELQILSTKYDGILARARSKKHYCQEQHNDTLSTRTNAVVDGLPSRALRRQQRRKEEENVDSKSHMSRHPVFSRYEKKQQCNVEELASEEMMRGESYQIMDFDDFNPDYDCSRGKDFLLEEDSIEQYLWHIEALQLHICRLKDQLTRGSPAERNTTEQDRDVASPGGGFHDTHFPLHSPSHLGGRSMLGGKTQGGKFIARKRTSDFDIDDVIMPDNVIANYIEPARHAIIETPNWRMVGDGSVLARGGSSEEKTDDEANKRCHVTEGVKEDHEQHAPWNSSQNVSKAQEQTESAGAEDLVDTKEDHEQCAPWNSSQNVSVAQEQTRSAVAELLVNTGDGNFVEDVQNRPASFGYVPRRKRRRRESRDIASITKNIEPLLSASQKDACDDGDDPLEEDGGGQKTSSTE